MRRCFLFILFLGSITFSQTSLQASSGEITDELKGKGNMTESKTSVPTVSNPVSALDVKDLDKFSKEFGQQIPSDKSKESLPFQKKEFITKALERTHTFFDLSSELLKMIGDPSEAERLTRYAGITKVATGIFRIGNNVVDMYNTEDLGKFGEALRGVSDLISYGLDDKASKSYSGLIDLKKEKEKIEFEVKLNKQVSNEKIQLLTKNIEALDNDIKQIQLLGKMNKETDALQVIQDFLITKFQSKSSHETEIDFLKKALEAEDERMKRIEQQVVSKEREYHMQDKGAFFIKFLGILSAKFLVDEQAYVSFDQLGKTILATAYETFKSEPVKTGKYLKEIGVFLYGIYGSLSNYSQNKSV